MNTDNDRLDMEADIRSSIEDEKLTVVALALNDFLFGFVEDLAEGKIPGADSGIAHMVIDIAGICMSFIQFADAGRTIEEIRESSIKARKEATDGSKPDFGMILSDN